MNEFITAPSVPSAALYESAGVRAIRYPGGSAADYYDWQSNSICAGLKSVIPDGVAFDEFMTQTVLPAKLDAEVTVNYGSAGQPNCAGPGTPEAAAAWVQHANVDRHYGIGWWEIGNEVWGSWEKDLHEQPHDAATYALATSDYSRLMKAQDPSVKIGVPLVGYRQIDKRGNDWDPYVLSHANYDYIDYHAYWGSGGHEDDAKLLDDGPQRFATSIAKIRQELADVGRSNTPISVSEWNSVYATPGKQTVSIVNGLYAGEMLAKMLDLGIRRAEFWNTFGCEFGGKGNYNPNLFGWQEFGSLGAFSEGVPFPTKSSGCHYDTADTVPAGTPFPTARAFELLSNSGFVTEGEHMLRVSVPEELSSLQVYAVTHKSGYGLLLFNVDPDNSLKFELAIEGHPERLRYSMWRYGKAEYDRTRSNGPWAGLSRSSGLSIGGNKKIDLPPYSMTVFMLSR